MAKRWNKIEEGIRKQELVRLYVKENKTIDQISKIIGIAESSVYLRLLRLGIKPMPFKKATYRNINYNVVIPKNIP